jgi:opacity protein-like surface antigen
VIRKIPISYLSFGIYINMKINRNSIEHRTILLLLFGALLSPLAYGQTPLGPRGAGWQLGVHGAAVIATPSSDFTSLPGVDNCIDSGRFDGGSGGGFIGAAVARYLPAEGGDFMSSLAYGLRLGFSQSKTSFETTERIGSAADEQGNVESVMATYAVETTISTLLIEPSVQYRLSSLDLNLGLSIGYTLGGDFSQSEHLASPSDARYADGTTERNVSAGTFSSDDLSSIRTGLTIGAGYEIPVSPLITVIPEISYLIALGSPVRDVDWSPNEFRGGVSILFAPAPLQSNPLEPKEQ